MDGKIKLLFTSDKKYYTDKSELIIWNYFVPKDLDDCISFVTIYQPKMILLDTSVDHKTLLECISKIKHTYTYSPITIFAEKGKVLEIITEDLLPSCKDEYQIEIPIEIEKKLDYTLAGLNFCPSLKGYNYIKRCLFEGICNSTMFENIEKCLYNKIADIYCTSKYSVERGINFSIRRAFAEAPNAFLNYSQHSNKPPSNGRFLKTLLIYIKYLDISPKTSHMSELPISKRELRIVYPDFSNNFY